MAFTLGFKHKKWQSNIIISTTSNMRTLNDLHPVGAELQKKGRENLAARPFGKSQQHDISESFSKLPYNTVPLTLLGQGCEVHLLGTLNSLLLFFKKP